MRGKRDRRRKIRGKRKTVERKREGYEKGGGEKQKLERVKKVTSRKLKRDSFLFSFCVK